jgi:hypothetical protein
MELRLNLSETVAREAKAQDLLNSEAIETFLREELRRRRVEQLFAAADRLAVLDIPVDVDEVETEIQAARVWTRSGENERL